MNAGIIFCRFFIELKSINDQKGCSWVTKHIFILTGMLINRSFFTAPLIIRDKLIKKPFHSPKVAGLLFHRSSLWSARFWKWEWWSGKSNGCTNTQHNLRVNLRKWKTSKNCGFNNTGLHPHHQNKYGCLTWNISRPANVPVRRYSLARSLLKPLNQFFIFMEWP